MSETPSAAKPESPPAVPEQVRQLLQSMRRYLTEVSTAISVQLPLNGEQVFYELPVDERIREQLRMRFSILVTSVCRRQGGRISGMVRTLDDAERLLEKLYPVNKE